MAELGPLVDCCAVEESERVFRPGVSPYAIDPDPLKRPVSRRGALFGATLLGSAALSACGGKNDAATDGPTSGSEPSASASATSSSSSSSARPSSGKLEAIDLPYCSQILCGVPLETAVKRGFFEDEGLKVKLVYMKGGALTVQALLGKSVDFVGAAMDVVVSAAAAGKEAVMIASLSSLPFFALVTAPDSPIASIADLKGKKIGVANLNTSDHLLARYLLEKNGLDPDKDASFAPLGPNLFDGLRTKQVDVGLVQEPALSRLRRPGQQGARQLHEARGRGQVPRRAVPVLRAQHPSRTSSRRGPRRWRSWSGRSPRRTNGCGRNPGAEIVKILPEQLDARRRTWPSSPPGWTR